VALLFCKPFTRLLSFAFCGDDLSRLHPCSAFLIKLCSCRSSTRTAGHTFDVVSVFCSSRSFVAIPSFGPNPPSPTTPRFVHSCSFFGVIEASFLSFPRFPREESRAIIVWFHGLDGPPPWGDPYIDSLPFIRVPSLFRSMASTIGFPQVFRKLTVMIFESFFFSWIHSPQVVISPRYLCFLPWSGPAVAISFPPQSPRSLNFTRVLRPVLTALYSH